jgi:hypothetical protein
MKQRYEREIQTLRQNQGQAGGEFRHLPTRRRPAQVRLTFSVVNPPDSNQARRHATQRGMGSAFPSSRGLGGSNSIPKDPPRTNHLESDDERIASIVQRVMERMGSKRTGGERRRKAPQPTAVDNPEDRLDILASSIFRGNMCLAHCILRP